jgi:prepilin-type N-terminal cleavage/methylation domain-containing protein
MHFNSPAWQTLRPGVVTPLCCAQRIPHAPPEEMRHAERDEQGRTVVGSGPARRGVTLIEVLLVLALLAFMASMGWPTIQRSMATQRLKASADKLRAQWVRARVAAIESGCVHVFRYSEDGQFVVERLITGDTTVEAPTDLPAGAASNSPTGNPQLSQGLLPEGIQFVSSEVIADARAANVGLADTSTLSATGSDGQPISFYPDGSSSSALVRLHNQYGRCIELSLRGLTGVVKVSEIFNEEGATLNQGMPMP